MQIVYEDDNIIVVHKDAGEPTQTAKSTAPDLVSKLKMYLVKSSGKKGNPYIGVIHRLDQPVEGLLVFAKDKESAASLSKQVQTDFMNKIYTAKVCGNLSEGTSEKLTDYMYKDSKENKSVIVNKEELKSGSKPGTESEIKKAELGYEVIKNDKDLGISILRVHLKTGRFHQIRAQLSHMGYPIVGDVKYGAEKTCGKGIGLIASELEFFHPKTKKKMHFEL